MQEYWLKQAGALRKGALVTIGVISLGMTIASAFGVFEVDAGVAESVLLILTLLVAASVGFWAGLLAAVVYSLVLLFFFLDPVFALRSDEPQHALLFPLFLIASLVGASLLQTSRNLAEQAQLGRAQADAILALNRAMNAETDPSAALAALCRQVETEFSARSAVVLTPGTDGWAVNGNMENTNESRAPSDVETEAAREATTTAATVRLRSRDGEVVFVPLEAIGNAIGVMRIDSPGGKTSSDTALIMAFAREGALALSRLEIARANSQADALRRAGEMKTSLLNSVSHDLKTPLASIKTSTSSLRNRNLPLTEDDRQDFYEAIGSEADRLDRTINDLLALSRLQAGGIEPLRKSVVLQHIVEDAAELRQTALEGRLLSIDTAGLRVRADSELLRLAVANLLENAARYSRTDGGIRVSARQADGRVYLFVDDDGPGMARDEIHHIFNPYYRARDNLSPANGTGLGLAIVKGFVEVCGGTVTAEMMDCGMRFTINLPQAEA